MNIVVTGLAGAGSSAVIDLLNEYDCNYMGLTDGRTYEHTFLYTPNGLFDLESKLLKNNDMHRSDEALLSFEETMKCLNDNNFGWFGSYNELFGDRFETIINDFLKELPIYKIESTYYGRYKGVRFSFVKLILQLGAKLIQHRKIYKWGRQYIRKPNNMDMRVTFPTKEEFFISASKLVSRYMGLFENKEFRNTIFDRLLLCQHMDKISDYFDSDFRVIAVKRDVRDTYFLNSYLWPQMHATPIYPTKLNDFIDYWSHMNAGIHDCNDYRVLSINFEDLVYDYENTVKVIEKHCGLNSKEHTAPKRFFQPERSINNTQVFVGHDEWKDAADKIEYAFPNYIYKFPFIKQTDNSKIFDDSRA